jgi:hypothetical protein
VIRDGVKRQKDSGNFPGSTNRIVNQDVEIPTTVQVPLGKCPDRFQVSKVQGLERDPVRGSFRQRRFQSPQIIVTLPVIPSSSDDSAALESQLLDSFQANPA